METVEGNKLIAEFMGFELVTIGYFGCPDETEWQVKNALWLEDVGLSDVGEYFVDVPDLKWHSKEELDYSTDWSLLMPVVEKINWIGGAQGYQFVIFRSTVHVNDGQDHLFEVVKYQNESWIECVWKAVIQFIQYYNQQSKS
jgi:hypothetical protein